MICKNCNFKYEGNFCNNCGQKSSTKRISYDYLLNELSSNFFQINKGLFFTIKSLFTRPGHSIREFLKGKRKQHFKPVAYVLLTSALYVILTLITNEKTILSNALSSMTLAINNNPETSITVKILNWLSNNFSYSSLLLLPLFSFASYISFGKNKYNFFEHFVLNCYITGQQILIYSIFTILFFIFNTATYYRQILPVIFTILFTFWTFYQFFEVKKPFSKILLTITTYLLYLIITMFISLLFGIVEGIYNG